jgi:hypothetical protein
MYQFIHIEHYARQAPTKAKTKKWTAREIADEADRKPSACSHVENPKPPRVLMGMSASEVVDFAEREVEKEAITAITKAGKKFSRGVRSDVPILLAGVASYPAEGLDYEEWRDLSLDWLKKKYGNGLRSVIEHTDEAHPHLHFYVVADKPSRTRDLYHDGYKEQEAAKKMGMTPHEASGLYRAAMRDWQNSYFESVSLKVGLGRVGPHRKRLSRAEWQEEKARNDEIKEHLKNAREASGLASVQAQEIIDRASEEAKKKLNEADDILSNAERYIRAQIEKRIKPLFDEEQRLEKWGLMLKNLDEKVGQQVENLKRVFQKEGSLQDRLEPPPTPEIVDQEKKGLIKNGAKRNF